MASPSRTRSRKPPCGRIRPDERVGDVHHCSAKKGSHSPPRANQARASRMTVSGYSTVRIIQGTRKTLSPSSEANTKFRS